MQKRAVFERSRRELSLDVSVGVHIFLVVVQSSSVEGVCQDSDTCGNRPILPIYNSRKKAILRGEYGTK